MPGPAERDAFAVCVRHVSRLAAGADGKILCHAEGEDGVMSALILFARRSKVVLKFPDQTLTDALFAHWKAGASAGAAWVVLEISMENGQTAARSFGPCDYEAPPLEERIPRLVKRHFGADAWDDSDPEPPAAPGKPWWRLW